MVFTPVEEVERTLVVPRDLAEKVVRDLFREEWVETHIVTKMLTEDLEEVVEGDTVVVAEEGTLEEAVEIMKMTPVGEGEDLTTLEKISKMTVVIKQLAMAR